MGMCARCRTGIWICWCCFAGGRACKSRTPVELASEEAGNPDPTQLNVSVLDTNAARAVRSYRIALSNFLQAEKSSQRVS